MPWPSSPGRRIAIAIAASILCFVNGCSQLQGLLGSVAQQSYEKPDVTVAAARIAGLSFDQADLLFDLAIKNPNPVGVSMAGFDYDFRIDGNTFLQGKQEKALEIAAQGENTIQLPVSVKFLDLYNTFKSLAGKDRSNYEIAVGMAFDVPVLGKVRIPIRKGGELPLLKIPSIGVGALKLEKMNWTSAELALDVSVKNPNAFGMILEKLDYGFEINGQRWAAGTTKEKRTIPEKGAGKISIPIELDFMEMGRSVVDLLSGNTTLSYRFGGKMKLGSTLELLEKVELPFDESGKIDLVTK